MLEHFSPYEPFLLYVQTGDDCGILTWLRTISRQNLYSEIVETLIKHILLFFLIKASWRNSWMCYWFTGLFCPLACLLFIAVNSSIIFIALLLYFSFYLLQHNLPCLGWVIYKPINFNIGLFKWWKPREGIMQAREVEGEGHFFLPFFSKKESQSLKYWSKTKVKYSSKAGKNYRSVSLLLMLVKSRKAGKIRKQDPFFGRTFIFNRVM